MFGNKMVTPATPERVYTLCKIVEKKALAAADVRSKMEPEYLTGSSAAYFQDYRDAAKELGLISISDNFISLATSANHVSSTQAMRKFANHQLEKFRDGQFYKVTQAYFSLGDQVFTKDKNLSNLAPEMTILTGSTVDDMAMRAWRFWVTFLGFGYLQDMFLIPNANVFLGDIISTLPIEKGKIYAFGEFIQSILPYAQIILGSNPTDHQLNYGVSCGLRTLHDMGVIKLEHIMDYDDIWSLYPMKAHPVSGTVTSITICK